MAKSRAGFDATGQPLDTPKGEPDPVALEEISRSNEQVIPEDPKPLNLESEAPDVGADLVSNLQAAFKDPAIRTALKDAVTEDPELRALFSIPAGTGKPSGHYQRNYSMEQTLRVTGGLEVEHPPSFKPLAPDTIKMYFHRDHEGVKTSDPTLAKLNAAGAQILTDEYKWFLDVKMSGKRPSQRELVDIDAGAFQSVPGDPGITIER